MDDDYSLPAVYFLFGTGANTFFNCRHTKPRSIGFRQVNLAIKMAERQNANALS
tara:strand:+ start:181508 stop:181669 length:162 start_codon:yes stop_codon:yes gene_type:complete